MRRPDRLLQEGDRPPLVEGLVPVATLRRLDTGGASIVTRAGEEQLQRGREMLVGHGVAELGDAGSAGGTVVDDDGGRAGVVEPCGGHAADIPTVTDRVQRQDPDGRMLDGMKGAGNRSPRDSGGAQQSRRDEPPDASRDQPGRRQFERLRCHEISGE